MGADDPVGPGAGLVLGVLVITALSLLGSVFLSSTANGIAVFMIFGAGLAAGLLGQIGDALAVETLQDVAKVSSWVLPFEALYQSGLHALTQDTGGTTASVRPARSVRRRPGRWARPLALGARLPRTRGRRRASEFARRDL